MTNDLAPIDGPYHGTRASSASCPAASTKAARPARQLARSSAPVIERAVASVGSSIEPPAAMAAMSSAVAAAKASASVIASAAVRSKYVR
ncbi:MAG: hypothetical protein R2715_11400 [Ilumatobacteraceae bacterium]